MGNTSNEITFTQLENGAWHIKGYGPCNWAQPPEWPCSEATLREHAFPEASEKFIQRVLRLLPGGFRD
jgi:hypothetical protein